jgi:hypothetical protein
VKLRVIKDIIEDIFSNDDLKKAYPINGLCPFVSKESLNIISKKYKY